MKAERTSSLLYLEEKPTITKSQLIQHYAMSVSAAKKQTDKVSYLVIIKTGSYENNGGSTLGMLQRKKRKSNLTNWEINRKVPQTMHSNIYLQQIQAPTNRIKFEKFLTRMSKHDQASSLKSPLQIKKTSGDHIQMSNGMHQKPNLQESHQTSNIKKESK